MLASIVACPLTKLPTAPDRCASRPTALAAVARRFPRKLERRAQPHRVRGRARRRRSASPTAIPWLDAAVDWDRTIAFREHLWDLGLGVAEAMDTAQRGMGLDWPTSLELIKRSVAAAQARATRWCSPAPAPIISRSRMPRSLDDVIRAYEEQIAAIEKAGGRIILMASRALASSAAAPTTTPRSMAACCRRCASP